MSMIPQPEDETIRIPVTFDYNGGRGDQRRGNILTTLVLFVVSVVLTIGMIRNDGLEIWQKILFPVLLWVLVSSYVRFKVFREFVYSDTYETLKEEDFQTGTRSFWKVYEVDSRYPYIHHFADGKHAVFIRLEKDVVVGKPEDIVFLHYDAIAEAYRCAGNLNISMVHLDYMDNVGNDPRLITLYDSLNNCSNPDMRELMISIYSNWQEEMMEDYASFDVYAFTTRGNPQDLWEHANLCVNELLNGNYLSYKALNREGSRTACMALLNLVDFSVNDACNEVLQKRAVTGIIPISISVMTEDGEETTIINKTQEELKQEAEEKQQREYEEYLAKKENAPSKRVKKSLKGIQSRIEYANAQVNKERKEQEASMENRVDQDKNGETISESNDLELDLDIESTPVAKDTEEITEAEEPPRVSLKKEDADNIGEAAPDIEETEDDVVDLEDFLEDTEEVSDDSKPVTSEESNISTETSDSTDEDFFDL